jgi:hypothetical protein
MPKSFTRPSAKSTTSDTPGRRMTRITRAASSRSGWMRRSIFSPAVAATLRHSSTSWVRTRATLMAPGASAWAMRQESRFTSSVSVTEMSICASRIPARRMVRTREALPSTTFASRVSSSSAQRSVLGSTIVTSLPSRERRRAMRAPTWPPPAMRTRIGRRLGQAAPAGQRDPLVAAA